CELVRVEIDLVLLDKSAEARDFRHPLDAGELVAQVPVLQAAQLCEVIFTALIHQRILKDPADTCRIRATHRRHTLRQTASNLIELLQDTAGGPGDVSGVFEDDVDVGVAEVREASDKLYLRGSEHGSRYGVGYLIFDGARISPHPRGVDNHLDIGEIGDRIQRSFFQSPYSPGAEKQNQEKNEEFVLRARFDNFLDHSLARFALWLMASAYHIRSARLRLALWPVDSAISHMLFAIRYLLTATTLNFSCMSFCPGRRTITVTSHSPVIPRLALDS